MKNFQQVLQIQTRGKGLLEITPEVSKVVQASEVTSGMCNLFVRHTSASLVIQENADPDVQQDLEYFFGKLVPENDLGYTHTIEGPDDMPSHIRSALTSTSEQIPLSGGKLLLGIWQGIFLWERRTGTNVRNIVVHNSGD
ncbi:MAG TPA: YjbQ family protein [Deltaproteobacteria bacterium]|nr:YjbQ family protein [Deltaproteobacteria bacterium]